MQYHYLHISNEMSSSFALVGIESSIDLLIEQRLPISGTGGILCLGEVSLHFSTFLYLHIGRYLTSFHPLLTLRCRSEPFSSTGTSLEIFSNRKYFLKREHEQNMSR